MTVRQKFNGIFQKNNSLLCIGLDPELEKLPRDILSKTNSIFNFNKAIIDATYTLVAAYKPNSAFYEAYGLDGLKQLKLTMLYLQDKYPEIPIILDAKRGDVGNTAKMYARSVFEYWGADAVTINPYLGYDAVEPFLRYENKLTILLLKTSNPDSKQFQDLKVAGEPFYLAMAKKIRKWKDSNIGVFVGSTYPKELGQIRKLFPKAIMLSAGIGAQSASVEAAVKAGVDADGKNIVFNASRSILYASPGKNFAVAAQKEAGRLRDLFNTFR